jgi:hypothetical protein
MPMPFDRSEERSPESEPIHYGANGYGEIVAPNAVTPNVDRLLLLMDTSTARELVALLEWWSERQAARVLESEPARVLRALTPGPDAATDVLEPPMNFAARLLRLRGELVRMFGQAPPELVDEDAEPNPTDAPLDVDDGDGAVIVEYDR